MFSVVGVVVFEEERGNVVEALYHTAFVVEVRESQGTADGGHAILPAEGDDGLYEGLGNLFVVNEVHPAETHFLVIPVLVGDFVDDGRHTTHHLAVFVGQELGALGVLGHGVLGRIQGAHLVQIDIGNVIRAVLVQLQGEFYKGFKLSLCFHRFDSNRHKVLV